ncbi:MAG TPA: hypothetical protein DIU07_02565 [Rhodobacteraceae bacterium]|nr:hypothetical protein [Paracoccaceae bacterium]
MDLLAFLMRSADWPDTASAARLASDWKPRRVAKGAHVAQQGQPENREFIILDGCVASQIHDPNGNAVCVGLYVGPCVVAPNIARTRDGMSLVSVEALSDTKVVQMDSDVLTDRMIRSEPVRDWANGVLSAELARKSDREWCLAALGGSDRLAWFRTRYPGYEQIFVHSLIASFLGMTPVTLSRLRNTVGSA